MSDEILKEIKEEIKLLRKDFINQTAHSNNEIRIIKGKYEDIKKALRLIFETAKAIYEKVKLN